ncbi:hypothetical protein BP5796_10849 [Coleophoma crateriformis]|uniref:N-acetyltransferase domain-containing protein n=1 Tax=Coleophoma crateriformis TaxID=565419 RepID=A0A3D8QLC1_9HELO|nr:hypothetical protein BP5796_10849 [Coleophoma crateriformis]
MSKVQHTPAGTPYLDVPSKSTSPIYLTAFYPGDVQRNYEAMNIPSVNHELISVPLPYTLADAQFWVDLQVKGGSAHSLQVLRSEDPENGPLIGTVSLTPHEKSTSLLHEGLPSVENECELGYWLHPDFRGMGLMHSGVAVALDWARSECAVKSVFVRVCEQNVGSRRIVESFEDFVRDEALDNTVEWPKAKGGTGKRKVLAWRWTF